MSQAPSQLFSLFYELSNLENLILKLFKPNCIALRCSKCRRVVVRGVGGPIWTQGCPGCSLWSRTCLAFQSLHPESSHSPSKSSARADSHAATARTSVELWQLTRPHVCMRARLFTRAASRRSVRPRILANADSC